MYAYLSVNPSVRPSVQSPTVAGMLGGNGQIDGRMDGLTSVRTDFPCVLQEFVLFGAAAQKGAIQPQKLQLLQTTINKIQ